MATAFLEEGAIAALLLQLHGILQQQQQQQQQGRQQIEQEEAALILQILDLLLHACPQHLRDKTLIDLNVDFFDFASDLLLVVMPAEGTKDTDLRQHNNDNTYPCHFPLLSIIHTCSASALGTAEVLRSRKTLFRVIGILESCDSSDEILCEAVGITKNLAFYSEDCRSMLLRLPNFLVALSHVSTLTFSQHVLERLSATFRNLAVSLDCRVTLVQSSAVLQAFVRMASLPNRSVLRNILNTLINLAIDHESCSLLIVHGDGCLLDAIKRILRSYSQDEVIRRRSTRLLRLLSNEACAPMVVRDHDVVHLLTRLSLHDTNQEVRSEASEAFARCAGAIQMNDPHYAEVMEALVTLAKNHSISADLFARTLKEQTENKDNCRCVAERQVLVDWIIYTATAPNVSNTAKDDACCVLQHLSTDSNSQQCLVKSSALLDALVVNAMDSITSPARSERSIRSLVQLASIPSNRKMMVNCGKLIQALIHFAAVSQPCHLKDQVKLAIMRLVKEV